MEYEQILGTYVCRYCKGSFDHLENLQKHVQQIHTARSSSKDKICPLCGVKCVKPETYRNHLKHIHRQNEEGNAFILKCFNDFLVWKNELEKRNYCKYIMQGSAKTLKVSNDKMNIYRCDSSTPTTRERKSACTAKDSCPSMISAIESSKNHSVKVEYWNTHIGHAIPVLGDELDAAIGSLQTTEIVVEEQTYQTVEQDAEGNIYFLTESNDGSFTETFGKEVQKKQAPSLFQNEGDSSSSQTSKPAARKFSFKKDPSKKSVSFSGSLASVACMKASVKKDPVTSTTSATTTSISASTSTDSTTSVTTETSTPVTSEMEKSSKTKSPNKSSPTKSTKSVAKNSPQTPKTNATNLPLNNFLTLAPSTTLGQTNNLSVLPPSFSIPGLDGKHNGQFILLNSLEGQSGQQIILCPIGGSLPPGAIIGGTTVQQGVLKDGGNSLNVSQQASDSKETPVIQSVLSLAPHVQPPAGIVKSFVEAGPSVLKKPDIVRGITPGIPVSPPKAKKRAPRKKKPKPPKTKTTSNPVNTGSVPSDIKGLVLVNSPVQGKGLPVASNQVLSNLLNPGQAILVNSPVQGKGLPVASNQVLSNSLPPGQADIKGLVPVNSPVQGKGLPVASNQVLSNSLPPGQAYIQINNNLYPINPAAFSGSNIKPSYYLSSQPVPTQHAQPMVRLPNASQPAQPMVRLPNTSQPAQPMVRLPNTSQPAQPMVRLPNTSQPAQSLLNLTNLPQPLALSNTPSSSPSVRGKTPSISTPGVKSTLPLLKDTVPVFVISEQGKILGSTSVPSGSNILDAKSIASSFANQVTFSPVSSIPPRNITPAQGQKSILSNTMPSNAFQFSMPSSFTNSRTIPNTPTSQIPALSTPLGGKSIVSTTVSSTVLSQKLQLALSSNASAPNVVTPNKSTTLSSTVNTGPISSSPIINIPSKPLAHPDKPGSYIFESSGDLYVLEPIDDKTLKSELAGKITKSTTLDNHKLQNLNICLNADKLGSANISLNANKGCPTLFPSNNGKERVTVVSTNEVQSDTECIMLDDPAGNDSDTDSAPDEISSEKVRSVSLIKESKKLQKTKLCPTIADGKKITSLAQKRPYKDDNDDLILQKIKYYDLEMQYLNSQAECKKLKLELAKAYVKNKVNELIEEDQSPITQDAPMEKLSVEKNIEQPKDPLSNSDEFVIDTLLSLQTDKSKKEHQVVISDSSTATDNVLEDELLIDKLENNEKVEIPQDQNTDNVEAMDIETNEDSVFREKSDNETINKVEDMSNIEGDESKVVIKGEESKVVIEGDESKTVIEGDDSKVAIEGDESKVVIEGDESKVVIEGDESKVVIEGDESKVIEGDESKVVIEGDESKVIEGDESEVAIEGDETEVVIEGDESKVVIEGDETEVAVGGDETEVAIEGDESEVAIEVDESKVAIEGEPHLIDELNSNEESKDMQLDIENQEVPMECESSDSRIITDATTVVNVDQVDNHNVKEITHTIENYQGLHGHILTDSENLEEMVKRQAAASNDIGKYFNQTGVVEMLDSTKSSEEQIILNPCEKDEDTELTLKELESQYGDNSPDIYTMIRTSILRNLYADMKDLCQENKKLFEELQRLKNDTTLEVISNEEQVQGQL